MQSMFQTAMKNKNRWKNAFEKAFLSVYRG